MWRPWQSLFLLSLVLTVIEAELTTCPEKSVCLIFTDPGWSPMGERDPDSWCPLNGATKPQKEKGYIWKTGSWCDKGYNRLFAELEIEPSSARKWHFSATLYETKEADYHKQNILNIMFIFGSAKSPTANITFINETTVAFAFRKGKKWNATQHAAERRGDFESTERKLKFLEYSFDIETEGEELFDLLAKKEISFQRLKPTPVPTITTIKDKRLPDLLSVREVSSLTTGAKIGIGLGVGVFFLLIIAAVVGFLMWKRKKNADRGTTSRTQTQTASRKVSVAQPGTMSPVVGTPQPPRESELRNPN